jgi:hypothetical protein
MNCSFNLKSLFSYFSNPLILNFSFGTKTVLHNSLFSISIESDDFFLCILVTEFILFSSKFSLSGFFLFCQECHLLDSLFFVTVFIFHTLNPIFVFTRSHILVLHFLDLGTNSFFILLLKTHDLCSFLFGLFDLLPCLHLLLLEEGNTIGQKLSVSLDSKIELKQMAYH